MAQKIQRKNGRYDLSLKKQSYYFMSKNKKSYFISFTEESWLNINPKYMDWAVGRVEIYDDNEVYAIDELRFATPRTKDWIDFREKWDFKDIEDLEEFKKLLQKFNYFKNRD